MRLLYLIDSLTTGGAEQSLLALSPRYAELGISLDVAYLHERPGLHAQLAATGATLHLVDTGRGRLRSLRHVRSLLRSTGADLLHTTLFEADVTGRLAAAGSGIPSVTSLVSDSYCADHLSDPDLRRWKVRSAQVLDATTARVARRFHAISTPVAEGVGRRLRIPKARIDVIPRGRDPEELGRRSPARRERVRARLGVPNGVPVLLIASRHEWSKGIDQALEAMPRILEGRPNALLVVAGKHGNQTQRLLMQVATLGIDASVRFLGVRSDVPDLLCAADVFILPSRWEGLGGVLIEAMALEAPIVASDLPAVRELLLGGACGLLSDASAPSGLSAGILACLDDAPSAAARAAFGFSHFSDALTVSRIAARMASFYERAMSKTTSPADSAAPPLS